MCKFRNYSIKKLEWVKEELCTKNEQMCNLNQIKQEVNLICLTVTTLI